MKSTRNLVSRTEQQTMGYTILFDERRQDHSVLLTFLDKHDLHREFDRWYVRRFTSKKRFGSGYPLRAAVLLFLSGRLDFSAVAHKAEALRRVAQYRELRRLMVRIDDT